jgi:PKD repeat protein
MKKQFLSIFAALGITTFSAQTPSPSWTISQNAAFTNTSVGIRYMDAVDANVMWVTGYDGSAVSRNYNWFSRTTNGGLTYTAGVVFPSTLTPAIGDTSSYSISNLEALDANTAWVCAYQRSTPYSITNPGGGVIYKTTNGGVSWANVTAAGMFTNVASSFANFVSFLTPSVGIANGDAVGGEYELWRTIDGGLTWTAVPGSNIPNPLSSNEYAIVNLYAKFGPSNFWFGTNQGRIYRTSDAGVTWNVTAVAASNATITEIAFSDANNGVAYAASGAGGATFQIFNTTNGGVTWSLITPLSPNVGRNDICAIPGTNFYASVGAGNTNQVISYSKDNGVTWTNWGSIGIQYLTVDFVDDQTGWAGSFSDLANPALGGIWKYNGVTFNSKFTLPVNICNPGSTVTVSPTNSSSGLAPLSFSWSSIPAGLVFSSNTASVPVITFSANGSYSITLAVTNSVGVVSTSSQVVNFLTCGAPIAGFSIPSTTICNNVAFTFTNTSTGAPTPNYTISTSANSGVTVSPITSSPTVSIRFATAGIYSITLLASSISGSSTITKTINIVNCTPVAGFTLPAIAAGCISTDGSGGVLTTANAVATSTSSTVGSGPIVLTWSFTPNSTSSITVSNSGAFGKQLNFLTPGIFTVSLIASNISGTSTAVTKTIQANPCDVGIFEGQTLLANVNIYPNPAHEQITVSLPSTNDSYKIKLVDLVGVIVYEEKIGKNKETLTINLANKAKGIYFLTVESLNNEKAGKKIIVE